MSRSSLKNEVNKSDKAMETRTEDKIRLFDIADAIQELKGYLEGSGFEEFATNEEI